MNAEYEPADFDPPNQQSSLLCLPTIRITSTRTTHQQRRPPIYHTRVSFDHSSPSSNGSVVDDAATLLTIGAPGPRLSLPTTPRPSSARSHSPQPAFHPSPRLAVANSFGNMSVHSPNWGTNPLPQLSPSHSPFPRCNRNPCRLRG
ncbi:hypothetical protein B0H34DRAFT_283041 [Crassisporium funariophilum]|nr:hypothetical protein B0H34DRAFT_283041 [Crassisporium funariophilum]